jgi:hypothetical protein
MNESSLLDDAKLGPRFLDPEGNSKFLAAPQQEMLVANLISISKEEKLESNQNMPPGA